MNTPYCLLDTRGLLLHAYHGSSYKSIPTEDGPVPSWEDGLSGFVDRYLLPLLQTYAPRQILATFDAGNTHRRMIYSGYKEHRAARDKSENPVRSQQIAELMKQGQRLLAYLGARVVWVPGEEADDLIALLCQRLEADTIQVITRDEDLLQLVNERTAVRHMDNLYTDGGEKDGFPVALTTLKKSIVGDTSDGYGGVKGAGPKFLEKLYEKYGAEGLKTLEQHIASGNPSALNGTGCELLQKLFDQRVEWMTGYRLASLAPQACYGAYGGEAKRPQWLVRVPNRQKVLEIFKKMHIESRFGALEQWFPSEALITADQHAYLQQLMGELAASPIVSYDFETTDKVQHPAFREVDKDFVDVLSSELVGLSINYGANLQHTFYVPFDHVDTANFPKDWAKWILSVLDQLPQRPVVQNANFELTVALADLGHRSRAPYDTATLASYADENQEPGLKASSFEWLKYQQVSYKEVTQGRRMHELSGDEVLSYGCDDSLVTSHLFDVKRLIMQMEGSWAFYEKNEVTPVEDDVLIFFYGTDVNLPLMKTLHDDAQVTIDKSVESLHRSLNESCNVTASTEAVTKAAQTLLSEWWTMAQAKYAGKPDAAKDAYQRLWEKAWSGCYYTTPVIQTELKFLPTVSQLSPLLKRIDPAVPALEKVTPKYLEEWYRQAMAYAMTQSPSEARDTLMETLQLLYEARGSLAAGRRAGPHYARLEAWCLELLKKQGQGRVILSGDHLNTNSADQMQMLLYGKMRLPLRRRSKVVFGSSRHKKKLKGSPATGLKAIASALVYDVTDPGDWRYDALLAYRQIALLQQEISLYYKKYPLLVHPRDGKMHPYFRQCGTATRRPTGTNPNDLQVSKKDGAKLRKTYVGGDYGDGERVYVCADFAAQEIQILACESRDPVMMEAFLQTPRRDLHSVTATGFAHFLLPKLGLNQHTPLSYEEFMRGLHGEDEEIKTHYKEVRNKYAKACIAEGSLVLTDRGLVPIESVELIDKVWDGEEWVEHAGVVFKGIREVMTYDGLTATPDHVAVTESGREAEIGALSNEQERPRLAVAEVNGAPVRFLAASSSSVLGTARELELRHGGLSVPGVRKDPLEACEQPANREVKELLVPENLGKVQGQAREEVVGPVQRDAPALHESEVSVLEELRGKGNSGQVREPGALHILDAGESASRDVPRHSDRQEGQQRPLRAWESEAGNTARKPMQQSHKPLCGVHGEERTNTPLMASFENLPPRVLSGFSHSCETVQGGENGSGNPSVPAQGRRAPVYDIINAGPRNRFTVSGVLVHNCNFLMAYGGGPTTLAENLMITEDTAKQIMAGTFSLYSRIQPWQREIAEFARSNGYSQTAYGNRRHAPKELWSSDNGLAQRVERQVVNAVIQGTAADILKEVRREMHDRKFLDKYRIRAVKPVYDEIAASVPVECAVDYAEELAEVMSITPPGYPVGMKVDLSIGRTWGSVREIESNERAAIEAALLKTLEAEA